MATDKREVELIIKANNLSNKTLKEVTTAVDNLSTSIDKQVTVAKKGEGSLGELTSSYKKLEEAGRALIGQQALIDRFKQVSVAVEGARDKAVAAASAFNQFKFSISQGGEATAAQEKRLAQLGKSSDSAQKALERQVATLANLDSELQRAGIDTSKLAASEEQLVLSANRVAAAQKKAAEAIDDVHKVKPPAPVENPFEANGRTTLSLLQRIRGEVLALAAAYVGLQGAIQGAASSLEALKTEQQIHAKLLVLTGGDTKAAAQEYQYLREQAERLGIALPTLAKQYSSFAIAAKEANMSAKDMRFVFEKVAEAGRVMHLSDDDINGIFTALQQMVSKGAIQAEELKGQLGERLPGAINFAAKAYGVSVKDFLKQMEQGNVQAKDGVIALARGLDEAFSKGLPDATKGIQAQEARFKTALYDFQLAIAKGGFQDAYGELLSKLSDFFQSAEGLNFAKSLGDGFASVAKALTYVVDNLQTFKTIAEAIVGLYLTKYIASLAFETINFAKAMGTAAVAAQKGETSFGKLKGAFMLLQAAIVGWEIGTVLSEKFESVRKLGVYLVTGFAEIWTRIEYGAKIAWEGIGTSWEDLGATLVNSLTKTFRDILTVMQKGAQALGRTDLADSIGAAINAVTIGQTAKAKASIKKLGSELEAELARIKNTRSDMLVEASDAYRAAAAVKAAQKPPAAQPTQESDPTAVPQFSGGDKALEKYKAKYESILGQLEAIEAQTQRKQKDSLDARLQAIDDQYAKLFREIKELGGKGASELQTRLTSDIAALKAATTEQFNKEQLDQVESIQKKFAEIETKIGKSALLGDLDQRLGAIDSTYQSLYTSISELDDAHSGKLKEQLDLYIQQLKVLEQHKYATDQVALSQKGLSDLVAARDERIKAQTDLMAAGLLGEAAGRERIKQIIEDTQPAIEAQAETARQALEAQKEFLDPAAYEKAAAAIALAAGSANKFKTELIDTKTIQQELASSMSGFFDEFGKNVGEAIAGAKSWGDALKETGKAFLNYAAQFLRKIAEMILQAIILKAIQGAMGGGATPAAAAVKHEGGLVGSGAGQRSRSVSPSWFAGAPKYHEGGVAGLAADEYPAILRKNEEVLTTSDPRNIMNGGEGGSSGAAAAPVVQDVKIINAIDSGSFVSAGLDTPEGTRAMFNFIRANRSNVKTILGS